MMNEAKKKRLIERGWKVGGVEEFLQLSPDEAAYVELRLKLSDSLKTQRQRKNLTQVELAKLCQIQPIARGKNGSWRFIHFA